MLATILKIVQSICTPLIVLGVLIFVHELGHFLFAKLSGVRVEKFSLGFGKELWKLKVKETEYILSLVPLGGFVQMSGESIEDKKVDELEPHDFLRQGPFKRFMIVVAGPMMNILLAFIFFFVVLFFGGASMSNTIGDLVADHPAQKAGIQINDKVVAIDNQKVNSWPEMQLLIRESSDETVAITVVRNSEEKELVLTPLSLDAVDKDNNPTTVRVIGVLPSTMEGNVLHSFTEAGVNVVVVSRYILTSLFKLATGRLSPKMISGPVAIMVISSDVAKQGFIALINFMALLSLSLAVFNLLPIPALDGSHLFYILCECILRRPISFKLQERMSQIGFACLMVLMVLVSYNDILNNLSKFTKLLPFVQ